MRARLPVILLLSVLFSLSGLAGKFMIARVEPHNGDQHPRLHCALPGRVLLHSDRLWARWGCFSQQPQRYDEPAEFINPTRTMAALSSCRRSGKPRDLTEPRSSRARGSECCRFTRLPSPRPRGCNGTARQPRTLVTTVFDVAKGARVHVDG